jgi:hypothetical protein
MVDHHLLKVFFEFPICLVESYLYTLLQSGVIDRDFVLEILKLLCESAFDCFQLFSNEGGSVLAVFLDFVEIMCYQI